MKSAPRYRNEVVLAELKRARGAPIRIPSQIQFKSADNQCDIYMPTSAVCTNLQQDQAAFEGWALVLKTWLDCNVSLDWEPPANPMDQHYQRFLYRVIRFNKVIDWFEIGESSMQYLMDSLILETRGVSKEPMGNFLVNVPGKRKEVRPPQRQMALEKMSENELELLFFTKPQNLLHSVGLGKSNEILRQIPVGVFAREVSRNTRVFPGVGGKADLGVIDDAGTVWLFELKKPGNNKVGVISELLFYSHIIRDIQLGIFGYEEKKKGRNEHRMCEADRVVSFILAKRLNGSVDNKILFELLNKAFAKRKEHFGFIKYQSTGKAMECKQVY